MGPIETLLPRRNAIGESLSSGLTMGLNDALQQMLETKRAERQQTFNAMQNKKAFGNEYGGMDPQIAVKLHEISQEYGAADAAYGARSALMNKLFGNETDNQTSPLTNRMTTEPTIQPPPDQQPTTQVPRVQPQQQTRKPIEQTRKEIHDFYGEEKKKAAKLGNRKLLETLSKDEEKFIHEANVAEEMYQKREQGQADIAKKKKELGQMNPVIQKEYEKALEQSRIADKTIEGVQQIDQLLRAGAQAPQLVTRANQIFGKDSRTAQVMSGIAASPLTEAVATAAVQQFGEGKNIFGQMRVTEFNEFVKKLQSVTDPKLSNAIKSVLLRGYAASDKLPYVALNRAMKELPEGTDQQVLERAEEIRSQDLKKLQANNKLNLTYLTFPEKFKGKTVVANDEGNYFIIPQDQTEEYLKSGKYRVPDWFLKR